MAKFDVPRGTRDYLPQDMAYRNHVEKIIRTAFEIYGFQQIKTPTFERFDLLAHRSGEQIRESMFTFVSDREEFALRPELTAAVCRLVASHKVNSLPLPYKLFYIGECFRYCRPQANRYREFTQAGVELIGSPYPLADAEVIAVAVKVLLDLSLKDFKLSVGNIGIFRSILEEENLDDFEKQTTFISNLDHIMNLRQKCLMLEASKGLNSDDIDFIRAETESLYNLQEQIGYSGELEIYPDKNFSDRERLKSLPTIADATYRALWKDKGIISPKTADLLLHISRTRGNVDSVLDEAKQILSGTKAEKSLFDLSQVCSWLQGFGVSDFELVLGVTRGLDFYTGTVFEIDFPMLGSQSQICGGGRYDKLVEEFGGSSQPATGLAFGFERLIQAFQMSGQTTKTSSVDIFVAISDTNCRHQAVKVVQMLRANGYRTGIDLRGLDLREQLGYAVSIGSEYIVILGPNELEKGVCKLREPATHSEESVRLEDLLKRLNNIFTKEK